MTHFLTSSLLLTPFLIFLFAARHLLRRLLPPRLCYHLWFLMLALLTVPFLPFSMPDHLLCALAFPGSRISSGSVPASGGTVGSLTEQTLGRIQDFSVSVSRELPSGLITLLLIIWVLGVLAMACSLLRARIRLRRLEQAALPLQNPEILRILEHCRTELPLPKPVPVYTTAYIGSPITAGLFHPRIYLPLHLTGGCPEQDIRFILLHELQHCRHKDALANALMNLARVLYWFHPLVRYALRQMRDDREMACDASVLQMLTEEEYTAYGMTLLNLAEQLSFSGIPFVSGIGESHSQIKKRILHIASYRPPTACKKLLGILAYTLIAALLLGLSPALSGYTAQKSASLPPVYTRLESPELDALFGTGRGSIVLYDAETDCWQIYCPENAARRISPNSTWKIYDALIGLEAGIITPENNTLPWDGTPQPFEEWNKDQNLDSALRTSVNWYFQSIDRLAGAPTIRQYMQEMDYGNKDMTGKLSSYWMESSLKISPVEQIELLRKLHENALPFSKEHMDTVKDALLLSSGPEGKLFGKTGTGNINGKNVNGWFVGYAETSGGTLFFSANIQEGEHAAGSDAARIILELLSHMDLPSVYKGTQELPMP